MGAYTGTQTQICTHRSRLYPNAPHRKREQRTYLLLLSGLHLSQSHNALVELGLANHRSEWNARILAVLELGQQLGVRLGQQLGLRVRECAYVK